MRSPLPLLVCLLCPQLIFGGTIEGFVRPQAKEGAADKAAPGGGAYDSRKLKFDGDRIDYSRVTDFVVYIEGTPKEKPAPPAAPLSVITQKGASFTPHVLPVLVGTTVKWPNKDEILHNVYSSSDPAQFDLGLYKEEIKTVTFDKPGRVDVFCSIHSKMHCVILVLETPYFARANDKNFYSITNVPPGTYRVKAWHERMPPMVKEVVVPEQSGSPVRLDFPVTIQGLPKR